jgi:thiosulfate dehydrogenase [quinone] large subunit
MHTTRGTVAAMRAPDRWLAVLRIVVGLWFLKGVVTKLSLALVGGVLPVPAASERWINVMPKLISRYSAENPFPFYKQFLEETVLPNNQLFAHLTAFGEAAVGLGLTLGFLTVLAAAAGLGLATVYGLLVQHMTPGQQGFHILLFACMVAFLFARAGRCLGIDGWLRRHRPHAALAKLPLG